MFVSCIMPTHNRQDFIVAAMACFQAQTHADMELLVLDDGRDCVGELVPGDPRIRYIRMIERKSTGEKRNICCELARGEAVCHFDDDDYSAPGRVADQVARLEASGKPITGYSNMLFWDGIAHRARIYRAAVAGYVCGTSLCYRREYWKRHPFPDKQVASDNDFVYPALRQIAACGEFGKMVARIHGRHTSAKTGIRETVSTDLIPEGFWENERLRLESCTKFACSRT